MAIQQLQMAEFAMPRRHVNKAADAPDFSRLRAGLDQLKTLSQELGKEFDKLNDQLEGGLGGDLRSQAIDVADQCKHMYFAVLNGEIQRFLRLFKRGLADSLQTDEADAEKEQANKGDFGRENRLLVLKQNCALMGEFFDSPALQAEFGTLRRYQAYRRAQMNGQCS